MSLSPSRILGGLTQRLSLAGRILLRRNYHEAVFAYARSSEMSYNDIAGDLDPLQFSSVPPLLDFSHLPAPETFLRRDDPRLFLSEPGVSRFLAEFVARRRYHTVLEIGCFVGWTTAHLATAAETLAGPAAVWAVEYDPARAAQTERNLKPLPGAARVKVAAGSSRDPAVLRRLPPADFVFIDTTHDYADTCAEIALYGDKLLPGGCLALHDSIRFAGVRKAILESAARYRRFTFATEAGNGLTLLFPRSDESRPSR